MLAALPNILPSALLMLMVLGTIYAGVATPTESAALGVIGAMIIALVYRQLTWSSVKDSAFAAIKTTAMITLIIVCAQMMSMSMSMLRIPTMLSEQVASLEINRWWIMAIICLLFMALGCVLEATSMQLLTLPVVFPVILALDFNPIWFGVVITVLTEMAQITPPVGINLFIIQGVSGGRSISDVALGILPFFLCQIVLLLVVCLFPVLSLWLPAQMIKPY
jgi:tripartite ATP-independent transporter DctM subunit